MHTCTHTHTHTHWPGWHRMYNRKWLTSLVCFLLFFRYCCPFLGTQWYWSTSHTTVPLPPNPTSVGSWGWTSSQSSTPPMGSFRSTALPCMVCMFSLSHSPLCYVPLQLRCFVHMRMFCNDQWQSSVAKRLTLVASKDIARERFQTATWSDLHWALHLNAITFFFIQETPRSVFWMLLMLAHSLGTLS